MVRLLEDQDRRRWDRLLIRRGLEDLDQAGELGGGPNALQAEIAAFHARAADVTSTDWRRIAALYVVLRHLTQSPVLDLNHAVAVSRADGPAAGLERLDALAEVDRLQRYPLFHAARGDMLERLRRLPEAAAAFDRAAELETNQVLRAVCVRRAPPLMPVDPSRGVDSESAADLATLSSRCSGRAASASAQALIDV